MSSGDGLRVLRFISLNRRCQTTAVSNEELQCLEMASPDSTIGWKKRVLRVSILVGSKAEK
ncbi:uncharacterized protein N7473_011062 [Penicillium subrubescens]|uniref:Uncharacterized protein n=1 Tax=Penicillium subrubescens TaxID=1316194 RepID=A0A1Q5UL71_9EURO|nr:uncharacterized protein N7473_011062 [Penicillium subrubescens]KAJ5882800.1 hypothetical protein N7473_011062 [Penicillium subrubescens]OKP13235.1 hypothetical protein PENSUB_1083 [Penicillium subrubescens]